MASRFCRQRPPIYFPNPIVYEKTNDITTLIAMLDIFLANVYAFYTNYTNTASYHIPLTDKPAGLLYHMYRKMPEMLVLLTVQQHPISRAILKPHILDFLWHIDNVARVYIKHPHTLAAAYHATLPTTPFAPESLLTRYPLYTGSTTPTRDPHTQPPLRRQDNSAPQEPHRRLDNTYPQETNRRQDFTPQHDSHRRPDPPKPTFQQRKQPAATLPSTFQTAAHLSISGSSSQRGLRQ